ncbi:glutathione-disulfide reductase [Delftia sp. JD2]|uniref:glutathione-disulfide reductase n=1 Tax=Delftia sp. JD2 TaxID=469553 RepID=UPI0008069602|nr:glutathione-disulfide reductase [Delftia sp. JD2]OBY85902.1 glutathione reductase [Delftia sp. JD2]
MDKKDFDLFVIGGGSGGVRAARIAAQHGARVAIAESANFGGTCVNRGCVPKKLMVYASRYADQFTSGAAYGWTLPGQPEFQWGRLIGHKDVEIQRLEGLYERNLQGSGVETLSEHAEIVGPHTVKLHSSNRLATANTILVATGGRPDVPAFPGNELAITSDQLFHLSEQPKRVLIVGGGYIAVEFAGIFAGLGSQVTQYVRGPSLLRGFDEDLASLLSEHLARRNVRIQHGQEVRRIELQAGGLKVTASNGEMLEVDAVVLCTGRRPKTEGLGLDSVGMETSADGAIMVDPFGRTSVESIYAIGDVTNRMNLTPVAIREGHALADRLYGGLDVPPLNYDLVPTAVFTTPEIGVVGLTEKAAREKYPELRVLKSKFRAMGPAFAGSQDQVFIKVLVDGPTDRVVGIHLLGDGVAEMVQLVGVALTANAKWSDFRNTVALHPTVAEEIVTLRG